MTRSRKKGLTESSSLCQTKEKKGKIQEIIVFDGTQVMHIDTNVHERTI